MPLAQNTTHNDTRAGAVSGDGTAHREAPGLAGTDARSVPAQASSGAGVTPQPGGRPGGPSLPGKGTEGTERTEGTKNPLVRLVEIARTQIGVHEIGNSNSGPRVREYQGATDCGGTGWPWCAAFICWLIWQMIRTQPGVLSCEKRRPKAASVVGLLEWATETCQLVFQPMNRNYEVQAGDIAIFEWKTGHHVALVTGPAVEMHPAEGRMFSTIEGNTAGPVKSGKDERNGGEVAPKRRGFAGCIAIIRLALKAEEVGTTQPGGRPGGTSLPGSGLTRMGGKE